MSTASPQDRAGQSGSRGKEIGNDTAELLAWFQENLRETLGVEYGSLTLETSLVEDLGADSLDVVELGMSLEEVFDLTIDDADLDQIKTIGDAIRFIQANRRS